MLFLICHLQLPYISISRMIYGRMNAHESWDYFENTFCRISSFQLSRLAFCSLKFAAQRLYSWLFATMVLIMKLLFGESMVRWLHLLLYHSFQFETTLYRFHGSLPRSSSCWCCSKQLQTPPSKMTRSERPFFETG